MPNLTQYVGKRIPYGDFAAEDALWHSNEFTQCDFCSIVLRSDDAISTIHQDSEDYGISTVDVCPKCAKKL